jgi:uncharacterized protein with PIN domain
MTQAARSFRCPTEGCPGNAWCVLKTVKADGFVERVRRCARCNATLRTYEMELDAAAAIRASLPLAAYFQPH